MAMGKLVVDAGAIHAQGVAGGQTALLGRRRGQRRLSDHVADGIDVLQLGLEELVDLHPSAVVGGQAGSVEVQQTCRAATADGVHHHVADGAGPGFEHRDWPAPGVELDPLDLMPKAHGDSVLAHAVLERFADLLVNDIEQFLAPVDQRHRDAKRGEDAGVLRTDDAAAYDGQRLGNLGQVQDPVAIHDALLVERYVCGPRRARPRGQNDFVGADFDDGALGMDRKRVGVNEVCDAVEQLYVVA